MSVGEYNNTNVKLVVDSALKDVMSESVRIMRNATKAPTPMQIAMQKKDKSEVPPLEKFKQFNDHDRDYWLDYYEVDITNSDIFVQIQTLRNNHYLDENFYWSTEMRRMVTVIISNHFNTDWKKDWRIQELTRHGDIIILSIKIKIMRLSLLLICVY
jgi:hypothetical protein